MSSKFLVIIIGSLGFFLACGSGTVSNQRQDALLESEEEEEITAEIPTVIAGSHLACSDKVSAQGFKKVICRISEEVDLDNLNLKYLAIRVNQRQIPISVNSERDFEIIVAEEEEINSDSLIIVDEEPNSNPQSADQKVESEEEDRSVVDEIEDNDMPPSTISDTETETESQMPTEEDQATPTSGTPGISDIPTVKLKKGFADNGAMNVVSFDKGNKVINSIEDFDDEFESNTFDLEEIDDKDDDILRDLSKLVTFRIELHNAGLSKGAVLKINDEIFGDTHIPNPQQLYSTAASGLSEIKTMNSFKIAVSPDAIKDETLWASNEECVEDNEEGPEGAIRSGALTVKIFDDEDELFWELSVYADGGDCDDDRKGKR